jgi:hypothetical protein
MLPPLKLNDIEQEHLQEVYDTASTPREELPYSPAFDTLCQEFQDRAFKNGQPQQIYMALIKYTRVGSHPSGATTPVITPEQLKTLKIVIKKQGMSGRLIPYTDEFNSARVEFNKITGLALENRDFWLATTKSQPKPRASGKVKKPVEVEEED